MFQASVCIATYRRPVGLHNLLDSLVAQKQPPAFEVVVVDNDRDGSAAPVVESFSGQLTIRYVIEPSRGLSRVRNRAIAESRGRFIAFIDDDEIAAPRWLATLDRVCAASKASAVFGPVHVEFEPEIPIEIRECRVFANCRGGEGARLEWYHSRTGNAYVDRDKLPSEGPPFSLSLNRTGGEDTDLFFRMAKAGATFVYAGPEGAITEFREKDRSDLAWLLRRALRNGGNLAELQGRDQPTAIKARRAAKGVRRFIGALAAASKTRRVDRHAYVEHLIDAGEEAGRFLRFFGYCYKEYGH